MTMTQTSKHDTVQTILERIRQAEDEEGRVTQRELAKVSGVSLGMINSLVRYFAVQGWIDLARRSAKDVRYAVTEAGRAELARRVEASYRDASRNSELYRSKVEGFIRDEAEAGTTALVFCGGSELSALFEGLCEQYGLAFLKCADQERAANFGRKPGFVLVTSGKSELDAAIPLSKIIT